MFTSKKLQITLAGIAFIVGMIIYVLPFILPVETVAGLVVEDSPIEYAGALWLFIAGVFFLFSFFSSRSGNQFWKFKTRRNYVYLILALALFFGAGEEITWGQRIFGFETPEIFGENIQEEATIHNLPVFDPTNTDSLFNMNRIFIYFWFSFGVVVPLLALVFKPARNLFIGMGIPITTILLGGQFLFFYILSKLYGPLGAVHDVYDGRIVELREAQHALIFMLIAFAFWVYERRYEPANQVSRSSSQHTTQQLGQAAS